MKENICKTCKKTSKAGVDIFKIHICNECLNTIRDLQAGEASYDYYKDIIAGAWKEHKLLKSN